MRAYEGLADAISTIITPAGSEQAPLIRSLLDFLTYRALRLSGRLSPGEAARQLAATVYTLIQRAGKPPAA